MILDREEVYTTQDQIESVLTYWQRALKLDNWNISIKLVPISDPDIDYNKQGCVNIIKEALQAEIKILRHDDWINFGPFKQDMERVIIHELMHVLFHAFDPNLNDDEDDEFKKTAFHQIIETLARSFVNVSRESGAYQSPKPINCKLCVADGHGHSVVPSSYAAKRN